MEVKNNHVCPWWLGYFLILPVRKFHHNPHKLLINFVKAGMNVLDFGCAMGYFSVPLAKMTGDKGKVYCVDIQEKMLNKLMKRARKAHVNEIIKPRLVGKNYDANELKGQIDFTMLFAVVHEIKDKEGLFSDLFSMTKAGGRVFFAEPKGHVTTTEFEKSVQIAVSAGFGISADKPIEKGLSVLFVKLASH